MLYVPTFSPAILDNDPVNVSLPINAGLNVYVNVGSDAPYILEILASAVTVIGFALMVSV